MGFTFINAYNEGGWVEVFQVPFISSSFIHLLVHGNTH